MDKLQLTEEEREYLEDRKLVGLTLPICLFILGVIACGVILLMVESVPILMVVIVMVVYSLLCVSIYYFMNRNNIMDLRYGRKNVMQATIERKKVKYVSVFTQRARGYHMPGIEIAEIDDSLYIPRKIGGIYHLVIQGKKCKVSKKTYENVEENEKIKVYYAEYSGRFLGFEKMNNSN